MPGENRDSGVGIYISKNHSAIQYPNISDTEIQNSGCLIPKKRGTVTHIEGLCKNGVAFSILENCVTVR